MKPAFLARAAVIAALYAVLTLALAPVSFGQVQFRAAEALMLLPAFTPAAVPGLFVGCVIANAIGAAMGLTMVVDIFVGSLATLIAALLIRRLRDRPFWIYMIPAVVVNGVIVGAELSILLGLNWIITMLYVALGEAVSCYVLGWPLSGAVKRIEKHLN